MTKFRFFYENREIQSLNDIPNVDELKEETMNPIQLRIEAVGGWDVLYFI